MGYPYKGPICRGSYLLGTACGRCEKCEAERKQRHPSVLPHGGTSELGQEDAQATIARLTAENGAALSMIRIAYDAGYHQAECGLPNHGDIDRAATESLNKRIGAAEAAAYERAASITVRQFDSFGDGFDRPLPAVTQEAIRALATEAETTALAEMLDAETRACAKAAWRKVGCCQSCASVEDDILARINQRKEAGK